MTGPKLKFNTYIEHFTSMATWADPAKNYSGGGGRMISKNFRRRRHFSLYYIKCI